MTPQFELVPHPNSTGCALEEIRVEQTALGQGLLEYRFVARGDIDALCIPIHSRTERCDGLWRTTCFEAFIKPADGEAYLELNVSPSCLWAAYLFDGYRSNMRVADAVEVRRIGLHSAPGLLECTAVVDLSGLDAKWRAPDSRLGLSAVIAQRNDKKYYWALAHADGEPDFHHPHCFAAHLGAATAA